MVREINSISWCVSGLPCRKYSSSGALADIKSAIKRCFGVSAAMSVLFLRNFISSEHGQQFFDLRECAST